jgi:hypothetical protein
VSLRSFFVLSSNACLFFVPFLSLISRIVDNRLMLRRKHVQSVQDLMSIFNLQLLKHNHAILHILTNAVSTVVNNSTVTTRYLADPREIAILTQIS